MTENKPTVLIVDDNPFNLKLTRGLFQPEGFNVETEDNGAAGLARVSAKPPSILLLDVRMDGMDGLETLGKVRNIAPDLPVIMLTAHNDVRAAIEAIKLGADDFLVRPIENDKLVLAVRRALERHELRGRIRRLRDSVGRGSYLAKLMVSSSGLRKVIEQIQQVARTNLTVLISGETGTGKEMVARAIHHESERADRPFVAVDCGTLPETLVESELFGYEKGAFSGADRPREGHFQAASGGSLFLDEVENLSPSAQATLLRTVQERQVRPVGATRAQPVDIRFIAASNDHLIGRVARGTFRQDLYYRLSEFSIVTPPLRERSQDIAALARVFHEEACVEMRRSISGISEDAIQALENHSWPGNVRELRNVIRRAVLKAPGTRLERDTIAQAIGTPQESATDPVAGSAKRSLKEIAGSATDEAERLAIIEALNQTDGNKTEAARLLGIDRKVLYSKRKRYGL